MRASVSPAWLDASGVSRVTTSTLPVRSKPIWRGDSVWFDWGSARLLTEFTMRLISPLFEKRKPAMLSLWLFSAYSTRP